MRPDLAAAGSHASPLSFRQPDLAAASVYVVFPSLPWPDMVAVAIDDTLSRISTCLRRPFLAALILPQCPRALPLGGTATATTGERGDRMPFYFITCDRVLRLRPASNYDRLRFLTTMLKVCLRLPHNPYDLLFGNTTEALMPRRYQYTHENTAIHWLNFSLVVGKVAG